jgi:hypothetical protein
MAKKPITAPGTFLAGHDIFCAPDNSSFYSTKPYSELDPIQQEIRLIKLLPDNGGGLIECTLLQKAPLLDREGQYTALSYCAGDPRNTDAILLNGTRFNVFANLSHALREVRRFWKSTYSDRDCLLWIDQISINQSDIQERSHQVRFMREIYQHAEQVLVCLSTKKINPRGMDWLLRLVEIVPPHEDDLLSDEYWNSTQYSSDKDASKDGEKEIPIPPYHWYRLKTHIWANTMNESFIQGWLAFYDIVEAPWWSRAWVFQEFIVASKMYFMYSGKFATWETLSPVLKSFCYIHRDILINRDKFLDANYDLHLNGPADRNLCRVIERVERGRSQAALDTMEFMINSKTGWSGKMDLKELLAHSRYCSTTDLRDKVFAFIGLADLVYGILPDYSHPLARVLTETTMKIIDVENSLDVLCHAAASRPRQKSIVPSWVVDWTCEELSNDIRENHCGTEQCHEWSGLPRNKAYTSFFTLETPAVCLRALQVRGVFIDGLVTELISDLDSAAQRALFRSFKSSKGIMVLCSSLVQHGDELWVLDGCGVPLILRVQEGYGYSLVLLHK